jgi:hypothetical protein
VTCVQSDMQSRRSSVTRSKTEPAFQTLRPPHSRVQLQCVLRRVPRYPIFRIPHYKFVLLLHVNWLHLKFTSARGYNGLFLTSLHFTEIVTVAIFLETIYRDLVCFCVTPCSCNTMLWRKTGNLKYAPIYLGRTDQLHGAEFFLRN